MVDKTKKILSSFNPGRTSKPASTGINLNNLKDFTAKKREPIVDNSRKTEKILNEYTGKTINQEVTALGKIEQEPLILPNYSGMELHSNERDTFAPYSHTHAGETDPIFLALSGPFLTAETDPVFLALSGPFLKAETDPIFLSLSGPWNVHKDDTSDPHGATLTQTSIAITNISGPNIQNTGDHILSGPTAFCTGMITHTSATPPTANLYPQGTIFIQYTA